MNPLKDYITPTEWFIIIKPGFLNISYKVLEEFKNCGWELAKNRTLTMLPSQARQLYKVHRKKDFYESLIKYMSSGTCMPCVISKTGVNTRDAAKEISEIKDIIRKEYGWSEMENVLHSSDSASSNMNEMKLFF